MNIISRGIRDTFRNKIRTTGLVGILALVIGLALTMLIARQAVETKITSVKQSIGNAVTVSPAGLRGFEGGGNPLTADQIAKINATAHVSSTVSSLSDRLTSDTTNLTSAIEAGSLGQRFGGESGSSSTSSNTAQLPTDSGSGTGTSTNTQRTFTPSITVTGTTDATSTSNTGTVTLSSGTQIDGTGSALEALVGETLATKNNLKVGSTFTAYGKTLTVKGIISSSGNQFAGNVLIVPLATLQTLSSQAGDVTSVSVKVDSIENTDAVVASLKSSLGTAADVVSEASQAASALAPLQSIGQLSLYALIAAVASGVVIIFFIMLMIVRERRREIGVMKAIGARNIGISAQFMVEAATLTILASILGIILAVFAAGPITSGLVSSSSSTSTDTGGPGGMGGGPGRAASRIVGNVSTVVAHIDWTIALYGLGAALLIALVGSLVASWFIANIKPAEAIRAE